MDQPHRTAAAPRLLEAAPPRRRPSGRRGASAGGLLALVIALAVPVLVVAFGIRGVHQADEIAHHGVPVTAVVTGNETYGRYGDDDCRQVDVSYTTTDGTPETATPATDGCLRVGSSVAVVYDPSAPDVAALRTHADPGISNAEGQVIIGVVLLLLELWALGYLLWRQRHAAKDSGLWRELTSRRTGHGIALAAVLLIASELLCAYFLFGAGNSDVAGLAVIVPAFASVLYLGVPRGPSIGSSKHWGLGAACLLTFVVTVATPRSVADAAATALGTPHRAVITQVEINSDTQGYTTRNYALLVDDGERLPLGKVNSSDIGTHVVGDTTTVYVDPHHLLRPEVTRNLGGEVVLALAGALGLVVLNLIAARRRRSS